MKPALSKTLGRIALQPKPIRRRSKIKLILLIIAIPIVLAIAAVAWQMFRNNIGR